MLLEISVGWASVYMSLLMIAAFIAAAKAKRGNAIPVFVIVVAYHCIFLYNIGLFGIFS